METEATYSVLTFGLLFATVRMLIKYNREAALNWQYRINLKLDGR
jgi:hypothetical protein